MIKLARADVDGHRISYRWGGDGPALVLLHGFTLDSRIGRRQLQDLSERFTVIAWGAPGAAASQVIGYCFRHAEDDDERQDGGASRELKFAWQ